MLTRRVFAFTTKVRTCGELAVTYEMTWKTNSGTSLRKQTCCKAFK